MRIERVSQEDCVDGSVGVVPEIGDAVLGGETGSRRAVSKSKVFSFEMKEKGKGMITYAYCGEIVIDGRASGKSDRLMGYRLDGV
jgi:hypothetical protein